MQITSILFIVCAALAAIINFRMPAKLRKYWLLALSLLFCASWSLPFCLILAALSGVLFELALLLQTSDRKKCGYGSGLDSLGLC